MKNLELVFSEFPKLETNRFLLREVKEKDYKDIYEIYSEVEAVRYQQIEPMETLEQAQRAVSAFSNGFVNKKFLRWCITYKECDKVVGLITLHSLDNWNSKAELGYMLNMSYWRQNIMSEAAQKVIEYAFEIIEFHRIEASIDPENIASTKLTRKLGFEKEGLKKEAAYNRSTKEYEDRELFALVKGREV